MRELRKSQYQRVSIKYSIICATSGLVMAVALATMIFSLLGSSFGEILTDRLFREPIMVAVGALFAAASALGLFAGNLLYRFGAQSSRIWLVGVVLAWSCMLISTLAGGSINFVNEMNDTFGTAKGFQDYVFAPVVWVVLVGCLPATVLGLLYAGSVRKALSES